MIFFIFDLEKKEGFLYTIEESLYFYHTMSSPLHIEQHTTSSLHIIPHMNEIMDILHTAISQENTSPKLVRGDDLFAAVVIWSQQHPDQMSILWKLLSVDRGDIVYTCYRKVTSNYSQETAAVPVVLLDRQYMMSQSIASAFVRLLKIERSALDFIFFLYAALHDMSPAYKNYLMRRKISVKKMKASLEDLAYHDMVLKV